MLSLNYSQTPIKQPPLGKKEVVCAYVALIVVRDREIRAMLRTKSDCSPNSLQCPLGKNKRSYVSIKSCKLAIFTELEKKSRPVIQDEKIFLFQGQVAFHSHLLSG